MLCNLQSCHHVTMSPSMSTSAQQHHPISSATSESHTSQHSETPTKIQECSSSAKRWIKSIHHHSQPNDFSQSTLQTNSFLKADRPKSNSFFLPLLDRQAINADRQSEVFLLTTYQWRCRDEIPPNAHRAVAVEGVDVHAEESGQEDQGEEEEVDPAEAPEAAV